MAGMPPSLGLPAERHLLSHGVAVGRILDLWPSLMSIIRQEESIVPPAAALLHIHTTRAESNKRGLRGINCLTWENWQIAGRHRQTMFQLWERGCKLLSFSMWCIHCSERGWSWIYSCELACRQYGPQSLHFYIFSQFPLLTAGMRELGTQHFQKTYISLSDVLHTWVLNNMVLATLYLSSCSHLDFISCFTFS